MSSTRALVRRAGWGVVALAGALLLLNAISAIRDMDALRPVGAGQLAPEFELPRIAEDGSLGPVLELSDTRGSLVIIDFWATWCGPCRSSMPVLEDVATGFRDRGLRVLSINIEGRDQAPEARNMLAELAPSLELLSDTGQASRLYKVTTIPHIVIVDRSGMVRWVDRGFTSAAALRKNLRAELEELLEGGQQVHP